MNKIRQYLNTFVLTKGFFIALLSSAFIYLEYWNLSFPLLNTFLGIFSLYFLLKEGKEVWFSYGVFVSILWFWWIALSFKHYDMSWAIPLALAFIGSVYGMLFWFIAKISDFTVGCCASITPKTNLFKRCCQGTTPYIISLTVKAAGLLLLSYIHPLSFDWFKPELMFVESYLGIEKWQFFILLSATVLSLWKKQFLFLLLAVFAYQIPNAVLPETKEDIVLVTTHTNVKEKWDTTLQQAQFTKLFQSIDNATKAHKKLIVLPESVFPVFVNHTKALMDGLKERAKHISIVAGGLYWDGETPRNSTYIFTDDKVTVANKVVLVPFGESNPLPNFLSKLVNKIFYDGASDYKASSKVTDYKVDNKIYRNAICFEATSEKLYEKDTHGNRPENMIVLSNNGWFTPSTEPTLQRLLLQYYSKKYETTIHHSVNMSKSYIIKYGKVVFK